MRDWIASESAKRLRNWDRAAQWRVLQQTITWAERQATVQRNSPVACLCEQHRKLSQMRRRGFRQDPCPASAERAPHVGRRPQWLGQAARRVVDRDCTCSMKSSVTLYRRFCVSQARLNISRGEERNTSSPWTSPAVPMFLFVFRHRSPDVSITRRVLGNIVTLGTWYHKTPPHRIA